jgi:hypothetical protein
MVKMKKIVIVFTLFFVAIGFAQETSKDSTAVYKKRVLETAEVDFLTSYYTQDGNNASVTGGIGTEKLTDFTPTIVVSMPLNADDVLTVDAGFSAYTSASSSNLNPFDRIKKVATGTTTTVITGASSSKVKTNTSYAYVSAPTPWAASSGASKSDVWASVNADYSHSSDDRNTIVNGDISLATEYDYSSIGFGGGITKLFNEKNTTLNISTKIYLDAWRPKYPTELDSYYESNQNLNQGYFTNINILNQNGDVISKYGTDTWAPAKSPFISNVSRNSYSVSFSFSQILSKNAQISLFFDLVQQKGWLANPMQRVYFGDVDNFYIGNPSSIPNYATPKNKDVFQLADDIERLPNSRFKIPVGMRLNYYLSEMFALRTYYRYYTDNWGVKSHTAEVEIPIKISTKFTLYPSYRYYNQTEADYFAPYEENLSTSEFYTSDFDLSKFNSNQYGFGMSYTDIFTKSHIWKLGLKSIDLKYNNYSRNTGLKANIISAGVKFVMD